MRALMKSVHVLIPISGRATRLADVRVPSARVSQPLVLLNGVEEPKNGRTTSPLVSAAPTWMCEAMTLTMLQTTTSNDRVVLSSLSWTSANPNAIVLTAGTCWSPGRRMWNRIVSPSWFVSWPVWWGRLRSGHYRRHLQDEAVMRAFQAWRGEARVEVFSHQKTS